MDKKAAKGYLVDFDDDERYRIWLKEQRKVIFTTDVVFQEKLKECEKQSELQVPTESTIKLHSEPNSEAEDANTENETSTD